MILFISVLLTNLAPAQAAIRQGTRIQICAADTAKDTDTAEETDTDIDINTDTDTDTI